MDKDGMKVLVANVLAAQNKVGSTTAKKVELGLMTVDEYCDIIADKVIETNEQYGLHLMLSDSELAKDAVHHDVSVGDFNDVRHKVIYNAIKTLVDGGESVDGIKVIAQLKADKTIEDAGGAEYITALLQGIGEQ